MPKTKIDTKWFINALKDRKISQRGLGRLMRLDVWSVWHLLHGSRRMQTDEAKQIADVLGVPLAEVLKRAGVEVGSREVPIVGVVRAGGAVTLDPAKPIDRTTAPVDLPADAIALLCRTARTPLEFADGCLLFTRTTARIEPDALGRLCLVQPVDATPLVRLVRRGPRARQYRLVLLEEEPAVALAWAAPILWIRT